MAENGAGDAAEDRSSEMGDREAAGPTTTDSGGRRAEGGGLMEIKNSRD